MKKLIIIGFLLTAFLISGVSKAQTALGNGQVDGVDAPVKASKKVKKAHKKSKAGKTKVSKTSAGEQDEVSDQSEVSQQADKTGTKKKR
ncbi:MAG TPA: hypothetical protein VK791_06055 [bacterium]|nr:hypothetical protein [bacterium]